MGPKWGRSMYQALEQVEAVQAPDKIALSGFARDGRIQRGIQDHLGLLKRRQLVKVAQELKEPDIPWQVGFAHTTKDPQVRLEQGEQTLRPMLVDVTTRECLLGMIDKVVGIALERPIAAGGVGREPTPRLHCQVGSLLHRLHRAIAGRVDDDRALATDPGDDGRPVFVIVPPTGLTFLATPTRAASQRLLAAL